MPYTSSELMTINAARLLRDGDVVFVGVGLPNLACNLARRTHAPNIIMIYEAGVVGAQPARLPLTVPVLVLDVQPAAGQPADPTPFVLALAVPADHQGEVLTAAALGRLALTLQP